jgi:hypothetical protein
MVNNDKRGCYMSKCRLRCAALWLWNNALIFGIMLTGFFIRMYHLDTASLWGDEAWSVCFVQKPWAVVFDHHYLARPGYFLMLKLWTLAFGYGERTLRLPSVLFGVASIGVLYRIGTLWFDKKTGIVAALLLAFSAYDVIRCQQARGYTLSLLLFVLTLLLLSSCMRQEKPCYYRVFGVVMILLAYTNAFIASIGLMLVNLFYITTKGMTKRWLLTQGAILLFAVPLLAAAVHYVHVERQYDLYCPVEYARMPLHLVEDFCYGERVNQGGIGYYGIAERPPLSKMFLWVFLGIIAMSVGRYTVTRWKAAKVAVYPEVLFVLLWFLLPALVFFVVNIWIPISRWCKEAIIILPAFYLLIALALRSFSSLLRNVMVALLITASVLSLRYFFSASGSESWKDITAYIEANIKDDEQIVLMPLQQLAPFWYYYNRENRLALRDIGTGFLKQGRKIRDEWKTSFYENGHLFVGISLETPPEEVRQTLQSLDKGKNVWLLISPYWCRQNGVRALREMLKGSYEVKQKKAFPWVVVEVVCYEADDIKGKKETTEN